MPCSGARTQAVTAPSKPWGQLCPGQGGQAQELKWPCEQCPRGSILSVQRDHLRDETTEPLRRRPAKLPQVGTFRKHRGNKQARGRKRPRTSVWCRAHLPSVSGQCASTANTWAPAARMGSGAGRGRRAPSRVASHQTGLAGTWNLEAVCVCVAARSKSTCVCFSQRKEMQGQELRAGTAASRKCRSALTGSRRWVWTPGSRSRLGATAGRVEVCRGQALDGARRQGGGRPAVTTAALTSSPSSPFSTRATPAGTPHLCEPADTGRSLRVLGVHTLIR